MKKIGFYSILSSGHLNVCASLATVLLNRHAGEVEIWFVVDDEWAEKLAKVDSRFKFAVIDLDSKEQKAGMLQMVSQFEAFLELPLLAQTQGIWTMFLKNEWFWKVDEKAEDKIKELNLDFLLCDHICHLPAMQTGVPYGFIVSSSPVAFSFEEFPAMGNDARCDEHEKIKAFNEGLKECKEKNCNYLIDCLKKRGKKVPSLPVERPLSDHFSIFVYPKEVDYFSDELKEKFKLWQIDSPLHAQRIPKPFELPEEFAKLPGQIIYASLGSMFSAYHEKIQRLVNILDKLPFKYIISKGPNGDKVVFPSNKFIGENFVDQLAVLQVADLMIAHGGNNTFCECFYFGVIQIILPVLGDQVTNATRIVETGYGYSLNLLRYTEEELCSTVGKALANQELKLKLKKISERIQKEDKIGHISDKICEYIENL